MLSSSFGASVSSQPSLSTSLSQSIEWHYDPELRRLHSQSRKCSPRRLAVANIILTACFDRIVLAVVLVQFVLVILQTDAEASDEGVPEWLRYIGIPFVLFYLFELIARLFVLRAAFFKSTLNICDLCLIMLDALTIVLSELISDIPSVAVLRLMRTARILRASRVMNQFRELYFMVHGLICAAKAVVWAIVILLLLLTFWSIVTVQALHPLMSPLAARGAFGDCERCEESFKTVAQACLCLFQTVVVGDAWADVVTPVIENHPWTAIVFGAIFVTIHFGVMNLVLTVIVDAAADAREHDAQQRLADKAVSYSHSVKQLSLVCAEMDTDGNGFISKEETLKGYKENRQFREILATMDAGEEDIDVLFEILDSKREGFVSHTEFIHELHKMKTQDSHTLLVFIKAHLNSVKRDVESQMSLLRNDILTLVQDDHRLLETDHNILQHVSEDISRAPAVSAKTVRCVNQQHSDVSQGRAVAKVVEFPGETTSACSSEPLDEKTPCLQFPILMENGEGCAPDFHQQLDRNQDLMLQNAMMKVEDQAAVLHRNCELMSSASRSLAKALARSSTSHSDCSQHAWTSKLESEPQDRGTAQQHCKQLAIGTKLSI